MSVFNPSTEKFTSIELFGEINRPQCFGSTVNGQNVFINSNAGLLCYNLQSKRTITIPVSNPFTEEHSAVAPFTINNELVSGFRNSFSYFNMNSMASAGKVSVPVIEAIHVNAEPYYLPSGSAPLHYQKNILRFSFTAFDFSNPSAIRFRYQLEGLEKNWTTTTQREANYYKLPPGKYTFKVQASNSKGIWSKEIASYSFSIKPPFWQTWWFKAALVLLFISVVISIAYGRVNAIKKNEKRKTAINKTMAELEMKALRSQMNPHFIFNSLNSIQKYIWENKQDDASEYLTKFARLIRLVLENSQHKLIPLSAEMEALKLYLELEHRRMNQRFDYHLQISDAINPTNVKIPPLLLQPYIENAIWHGLSQKEGRGNLNISISQKNNLLHCVIKDDGIGRKAAMEKAKSKEHRSLAMNISSERVNWLKKENTKASVEIQDDYKDETPAGTTVILHLPLISGND